MESLAKVKQNIAESARLSDIIKLIVSVSVLDLLVEVTERYDGRTYGL